MSEQKYANVHPACIIRMANDKRDRTTAAYREWIAKLGADIKERGIRNPLQVMREGEKLRLLAGGCRLDAALLVGLDKVPVSVLERPLSSGEQLREQLLENEMRSDFNDLERAEMYAEMMAVNNWTAAELARDLKVSPGQVSRVLAVSHRLPDDLKALVGRGDSRIGPRAAYQLSRLGSPDEMRELADKLLKGLLKVESLEVEVASRLGKKKPKPKAVKVNLGGMVVILSVQDIPKITTLLAALDAGLKKLEKFSLPVSALPQILKTA